MVTKKETIIILIFSIIFVFLNRNHFFFWDNISQLAVPANYYFDTNFKTLYLPSDIATGHQPFFAMYIAIGWMVFGKSIIVSHWLMLPLVFAVAYELLKFIRFFEKDESKSLIIYLICLIDSVLISQLSLITFEIPHLLFFLAALNSILRGEKRKTAVFFALLFGATSERGIISGTGFILFYFLYEILLLKKINYKNYYIFVPGILLLALFLITFYLDHGWIIHNTVSKKWEQSGKQADLKGALRNTVIFVWKTLDFGRIVFWLLFIKIIYEATKFKKIDNNFKILFMVSISQFFAFFATTIPMNNTIAHRYILPATLIFGIAVTYWFLKFQSKQNFYIAYIILFLLSGYIWIYPEKISKGWDAMPSHTNYFQFRNNAVNYLKKNNIPIEKTGSAFPNLNTFENTNLEPSQKTFKEIDLQNDEYILYSNVYNASDEVIEAVKSRNFKPVYSATDGFVEVTVYRRVKK